VRAQLIAVAVAFATLGVIAVVAPWPLLGSRPALVAVAALAGLAAWSALSVDWARVRDLAADETAQLALYATVLAGGAVVLRSRPIRALAPVVLLGGVIVVAVVALAGRLLPDVFPTEPNLRAGARLQEPLTYWNALGLLMVFGLLLATSVATDPGRDRRVRALACGGAIPCALVLHLTFSRGSIMALAAGYVVLFLLRTSWSTLAAGAIVLTATAALAALLALFPAVLELESGSSTQTGQGAIFLPIVLAATAGSALAYLWLSARRNLDAPVPLGPAFRRGLALATVAAVIAVGWLIATGSEKTDPLPSSKARLTKLTTNRGEYWRVAVDSFAAHPVIGVGAGSFGVEWRRERSSDDFAQDAHSLYLETLAELGTVGVLLLGAFLAAVVLALLRAVRDEADPLAAVAAAVVTAFVIHVGIDWTWEFPAVTLVALLLAAAALAVPARSGAVGSPGRVAAGVARARPGLDSPGAGSDRDLNRV
jgi:hypothetical protein